MQKLALTIGGTPIPTPEGIKSLQGVDLNRILSVGITTLLVFAVLLTLFFLIYGGISFITSGGDKQKVVAARQKLTFAIVGLIVVFLSYFFVNLIYNLFGLQFITPAPPSPICTGAGTECFTP